MNRTKSHIILFCTIVSTCFSLISFGQERQFTLTDAESEFNKPLGVILNNIKKMGYVLNEYAPDERSYHYTKINPLVGSIGADILMGFSKIKTLVLFQWVEYRGYQDIITEELAEAGFESDEHQKNANSRVYNNFNKGFRIVMIVPPSSLNTIRVILEVIPGSKRQAQNGKMDMRIQHYLPEPYEILNCTYKKLIDSLKRNDISYTKDSSLAEDEFIGYNLRTTDGEYFLRKDFSVGAYTFQIPIKFGKVYQYYLQKGAKLKSNKQWYCSLFYKTFIIEISDMQDKTFVTFNK